MNTLNQKMFAWCGIAAAVALFVGIWVVAGFVPPPSPETGAAEIAARFQQSATAIRIGMWICVVGITGLGPWAVVISLHMKRMEGRYSPLASLQQIFGAFLVLEVLISAMAWEVAAFRPLESEVVTQRFNDLGWLSLLSLVYTGVAQALGIATAVFQDKRARPVLPRWVAYANLWCAALFLPGGAVVVFKTGPLAWNGLFCFWIPFVVFTAWVIGMAVVVLRYAIPHLEGEEALAGMSTRR